jgi:hypothetical protein
VLDALIAGRWSLCWQAIEHLILPAFILGWGVMGTSRGSSAPACSMSNEPGLRPDGARQRRPAQSA